MEENMVDVAEMALFISKKTKIDMKVVLEILEAEFDYLKLIGLVEL